MISTINFLQELDKREGELVLKVERFEGFATSQACAKAECDLVHELRNEIIKTMDAKELEAYVKNKT